MINDFSNAGTHYKEDIGLSSYADRLFRSKITGIYRAALLDGQIEWPPGALQQQNGTK